MEARLTRLLFSNLSRHLSHSPKASILEEPALLPLPLVPSTRFSTIPSRPTSGDRSGDDPSDDIFLRSLNFGGDGDGDGDAEEEKSKKTQQKYPTRMPGWVSKGEQRPAEPSREVERSDTGSDDFFAELDRKHGKLGSASQVPPRRIPHRPTREGQEFRTGSEGYGKVSQRFARGPRGQEWNDQSIKTSDQSEDPMRADADGKQFRDTLFQKLKIGDARDGDKVEEARQNPSTQIPGSGSAVPETPPENADEIFKKMKETGLIPNAVAMLDGLCKDGLVQEAMKLFGSMREKGTIPEVVIYTAVVEGFCKAAKFDDAKRIFQKMQKNGVAPNAYSYMVLIQGLCRGRRFEDSVEFCGEMLDAGHLPNAATFTSLVDGLCKEKGLEEAAGVVRSLRERGFAVDEKVIREHMDKKGPFSPMAWEAIFGKKNPQRPF